MLTSDDLLHLAELVKLDPDFFNSSDDMLIKLFWHEVMHHHFAGRAVLREVPDDIFLRMMTDPRMMALIVQFADAVASGAEPPAPPLPPTLAERLEAAARDDIFYDAETFGDDEAWDGLGMDDRIGDAQDAMMAAARILRENNLDRVL